MDLNAFRRSYYFQPTIYVALFDPGIRICARMEAPLSSLDSSKRSARILLRNGLQDLFNWMKGYSDLSVRVVLVLVPVCAFYEDRRALC